MAGALAGAFPVWVANIIPPSLRGQLSFEAHKERLDLQFSKLDKLPLLKAAMAAADINEDDIARHAWRHRIIGMLAVKPGKALPKVHTKLDPQEMETVKVMRMVRDKRLRVAQTKAPDHPADNRGPLRSELLHNVCFVEVVDQITFDPQTLAFVLEDKKRRHAKGVYKRQSNLKRVDADVHQILLSSRAANGESVRDVLGRWGRAGLDQFEALPILEVETSLALVTSMGHWGRLSFFCSDDLGFRVGSWPPGPQKALPDEVGGNAFSYRALRDIAEDFREWAPFLVPQPGSNIGDAMDEEDASSRELLLSAHIARVEFIADQLAPSAARQEYALTERAFGQRARPALSLINIFRMCNLTVSVAAVERAVRRALYIALPKHLVDEILRSREEDDKLKVFSCSEAMVSRLRLRVDVTFMLLMRKVAAEAKCLPPEEGSPAHALLEDQ